MKKLFLILSFACLSIGCDCRTIEEKSAAGERWIVDGYIVEANNQIYHCYKYEILGNAEANARGGLISGGQANAMSIGQSKYRLQMYSSFWDISKEIVCDTYEVTAAKFRSELPNQLRNEALIR